MFMRKTHHTAMPRHRDPAVEKHCLVRLLTPNSPSEPLAHNEDYMRLIPDAAHRLLRGKVVLDDMKDIRVVTGGILRNVFGRIAAQSGKLATAQRELRVYPTRFVHEKLRGHQLPQDITVYYLAPPEALEPMAQLMQAAAGDRNACGPVPCKPPYLQESVFSDVQNSAGGNPLHFFNRIGGWLNLDTTAMAFTNRRLFLALHNAFQPSEKKSAKQKKPGQHQPTASTH